MKTNEEYRLLEQKLFDCENEVAIADLKVRKLEAQLAERDRSVIKANEQAERFEREWYLRGDELDEAQKLLLLANCALVKAYDEGITEGAAPNNLGRNTLIALEEAISAINDSKAVDGLILCDAKPVTRVSAIADNFGAVYVSLREPLYRTPEY